LWIFGGLLLLFAVLYVIFLVVLISQGHGMFHHHGIDRGYRGD
jgi:hypothetical protein